MILSKRFVFAALLALSSSTAFAADRYEIDPTHTQVQFGYSHFGYSHITGRFDQVKGEFLFDAADPTKSSIEVSIPVASISTGVAKLDEHLQSADFFDTGKFPEATFKSGSITVVSEGKLAVAGELTIHGVSKPVVLDVTINKAGQHPMTKVLAAGFDASTTLKRSDFGVGAYAPAVSDEVSIRITLEAQKAEAQKAG